MISALEINILKTAIRQQAHFYKYKLRTVDILIRYRCTYYYSLIND